MANYQSQYTGEQIDEAVGKALSASGGGSVPNVLNGTYFGVDTISLTSTFRIYVDFESDGMAFKSFGVDDPRGRGNAFYFFGETDAEFSTAYDGSGWKDNARYISFANASVTPSIISNILKYFTKI